MTRCDEAGLLTILMERKCTVRDADGSIVVRRIRSAKRGIYRLQGRLADKAATEQHIAASATSKRATSLNI